MFHLFVWNNYLFQSLSTEMLFEICLTPLKYITRLFFVMKQLETAISLVVLATKCLNIIFVKSFPDYLFSRVSEILFTRGCRLSITIV